MAIGVHIQHGEVDRVGAVEIHGLRVGRGGWIAVADKIVQTWEADEASTTTRPCWTDTSR